MSQKTNTLGIYKENLFIEAGIISCSATDTFVSRIRNVKFVSAIRASTGAAVATTVTANNSGGATITVGSGPSSENVYFLIAGDGV